MTKTYATRGPLQQYRLATSTAFECFRCGSAKTSKLITVLNNDWGHLLCNGCYGRLLSLHTVRNSTTDEAIISDALADELVALLPADELRRAEDLLRLREKRIELLEPKSIRLIATADYVAVQLAHATGLDWSAAIIGICKAVEIETVARVVNPLRNIASRADLAADVADKDLSGVARYCAGHSPKPPELGALRHFLVTAANSTARQETSLLLRSFRKMVQAWPRGDWLLSPTGAAAALATITVSYRNPAAHTEELTAVDYHDCSQLVLGQSGALWQLLAATTSR